MKEDILERLEEIQREVDAMGFKGQNEYDLHLREEIADYIMQEFEHFVCREETRTILHNDIAELSCILGDSISLLRELADLQNGAPLESYRKEWEEKMEKVYNFLDKHE